METVQIVGLLTVVLVVSVALSWAGRRFWWHSPTSLAAHSFDGSVAAPSSSAAPEATKSRRGWVFALVLLVLAVARRRRRRRRRRLRATSEATSETPLPGLNPKIAAGIPASSPQR